MKKLGYAVLIAAVFCLIIAVPVMAGGHGHGHGGKAVNQWQTQNLGQFQMGTGVSIQGYKTNAGQFYATGSHGTFATGATSANTFGAQATFGGGQVQEMNYSSNQGVYVH